MSEDLSGIARQLQATRKARGLSQRELSALAGVPQAQISRIEAGTVDLRLSSLAALAHALDLKLALFPRQAAPAVRSLSREVILPNHNTNVIAQKEMRRIDETMRGIQIRTPNLKGLQQLQKSFFDLHRFELSMLDIGALKKLRQTIEQISHAKEKMIPLNESLKQMRDICAKASEEPRRESAEAPSRPAYSLDEEGDNA